MHSVQVCIDGVQALLQELLDVAAMRLNLLASAPVHLLEVHLDLPDVGLHAASDLLRARFGEVDLLHELVGAEAHGLLDVAPPDLGGLELENGRLGVGERGVERAQHVGVLLDPLPPGPQPLLRGLRGGEELLDAPLRLRVPRLLHFPPAGVGLEAALQAADEALQARAEHLQHLPRGPALSQRCQGRLLLGAVRQLGAEGRAQVREDRAHRCDGAPQAGGEQLDLLFALLGDRLDLLGELL
mmetsp:Transcript_93319/g.290989  ORF Transcript_93319/g.290989 Transcript_93319/m.290989 type:complete len:242 (-) Transcript_93319:194-919(-)